MMSLARAARAFGGCHRMRDAAGGRQPARSGRSAWARLQEMSEMRALARRRPMPSAAGRAGRAVEAVGERSAGRAAALGPIGRRSPRDAKRPCGPCRPTSRGPAVRRRRDRRRPRSSTPSESSVRKGACASSRANAGRPTSSTRANSACRGRSGEGSAGSRSPLSRIAFRPRRDGILCSRSTPGGQRRRSGRAVRISDGERMQNALETNRVRGLRTKQAQQDRGGASGSRRRSAAGGDPTGAHAPRLKGAASPLTASASAARRKSPRRQPGGARRRGRTSAKAGAGADSGGRA